MPIYPGRRKGTWRVVVWSKNVPHETIVEGTKGQARAHEATERLKLDRRTAESRVAPTFLDFSRRQYVPHAIEHLRDSTWKSRRYQVTGLVDFFGDVRVNRITTELVEQFKKSRTDLVPSSINMHLRVLSAMANWGRKAGVPFSDFAIKYLPERGRGRVKFWTTEEVGRIFAAAEAIDPDMLPIIQYLANTGCRKGEALAAELDWVDFEARLIRIPVNEYWQPKSGEPREVPISDAILPMLQAIPKGQRWLFPNRFDERYTAFPWKRFDTLIQAAETKGGPHKFRHTFASHFLKSVPDLFLLAQVLGHSVLRVTELYSHLLPDHLLRARNAVNLGTMAGAMATHT